MSDQKEIYKLLKSKGYTDKSIKYIFKITKPGSNKDDILQLAEEIKTKISDAGKKKLTKSNTKKILQNTFRSGREQGSMTKIISDKYAGKLKTRKQTRWGSFILGSIIAGGNSETVSDKKTIKKTHKRKRKPRKNQKRKRKN